MTQEDIDYWKKNSNQKKYDSPWEAYYENGIIPNIWKGITGQTSADRNADKALEESREMYDLENQWQREKYAQDLDFANRQLQSQVEIADKNFGLQQSQFQYQKDLNELQMQREDNAIQRQVADYKAAGFSPLAAIGGNGSAAGSLNAGTAPQYDGSGIAAAAGQYLDLSRQYASLHEQMNSKYRSERQAAKFALNQMKADMHYKGMSMAEQYFNAAVNAKNKSLQNESLSEDIQTKKYANSWYKEHGYSQTTLATVLSDFLNREDIAEAKKKMTELIAGGLNNLASSFDKLGDHIKTAFKNDGKNVTLGEKANNEILQDFTNEEASYALDWCKKKNKKFNELTLWDLLDLADDYSKYSKGKR